MPSAQDYTNMVAMGRKILMPDGTIENVSDDVHGALVTIPLTHFEVHEGDMFAAWTNFEGIADDGVGDIFIVTGALEVHLKQIDMWVNNARATYDIYENAQGVGATLMPVRNRNRVAAAAGMQATMCVWNGITGANIGSDIIDHGVAGGGGANTSSRTGGARSQDIELILRPNTNYAVRITNLSGAAADVEWWMAWYEEESS